MQLVESNPVWSLQRLNQKLYILGNVDDEISFKPDAMALESILNNKGIDNRSLSRHTMASTRTMAFTKRQSIFEDNKVSFTDANGYH